MQKISKKTDRFALILNKRRKGFTLVELIVVIAIIGILVLLAMPWFMGYVQDAKEVKAQHDARVAGDKVEEYLIDHEDFPSDLPTVSDEDIQDAIEEGRLYGPEGPVEKIEEGSFYDVISLPDMPNVDGRPISDGEGNTYLIIEKPIRSEAEKKEGETTAPIVYTQEDCFNFDEATGTINYYEYHDYCPMDVNIPPTINGINVKTIGGWAFYGYGFTSMTIPEGVETIEDGAFGDNYLTHVEIPGTVKIIGEEAFQENNLTDVTLREGLESIKTRAFSENELVEIVFPSSLRTVGAEAFNHNKLKAIVIPAMVSDLGAASWEPSNPFALNPTLTTIHVNPLNATYVSIDGAVYTKDGLTLISGTKEMSTSMHPDVSVIGADAFRGMGLTNVTIPDSVTTIKYTAFKDNTLEHVTIPNSVTTMEVSVFENSGIETISIGAGLEHIPDRTFMNNNIKNVEIPDNILSIGRNAFTNNKIEDITFSTNMDTIGAQSFSENNITSISIPGTIKTIGENAFQNNKINELILSEGLETIKSWAFDENMLTEVTFPDSLNKIEQNAFRNNDNLLRISIGWDVDIGNNLLVYNNNAFRSAYVSTYGSVGGTYSAESQTGVWTKE